MKKYGIKILYGILLIGIVISIFHALNDSGGSAFGNIIETFIYTSLLIFITSIALLILSFKYFSKKVAIWILLLLSIPLAIKYISYSVNELYLEMIDTTTPKEFVYEVEVDSNSYHKDKARLQKQIDSLIKIEVIVKPAELAPRYFGGQFYKDTLKRDWAIDLSFSLEYKQTIVDTLFYNENGNEVVAGLLINKVFNEYIDYPNGGIEFIGRGFRYYKDKIKPFVMLSNSVSGHKTYSSCSDRLRYYYFKKIGSYENKLNMNDTRFLNSSEQ
ncbi:hypothetical protein [Sediminitomix flava]|uniref:Uncharacterized protein n=1 Tax=Sediminitomix flava TaxID=379075 RepID=A0A315YVT6_SEDFL|nr:hypothetical protein [Sediminitomix flava]PWJ33243.1 hypothetical protein BC781_1145 [Sediminitomix flava]